MLLLRLSGPDHMERGDRLAAQLPDAEFDISGHIVADVCLDERLVQGSVQADNPCLHPSGNLPGDGMETLLRLSILTIEDW
ncbi:MAG: hypothetical protein EP321_05570 [Sphingomonadales bacterium]|nr:MAG: hypothetical protein EP345_01260 [Sphingomonadales bacterium]TNF04862.1 MAG: hypothetical protein EP321_05570 [Sphingomonadales bacterium]